MVAALPDLQRDAVAIRYAAGLTAGEIGLVIGKSEEATQKLISRAVAQLKETYRDVRFSPARATGAISQRRDGWVECFAMTPSSSKPWSLRRSQDGSLR